MAERAQGTQASPEALTLEVSDIQEIVLRPRTSPCKGDFVGPKITDAAHSRELLRQLLPYVAPADDWWKPILPTWLGIAITHADLDVLGLPQHRGTAVPPMYSSTRVDRLDADPRTATISPKRWRVLLYARLACAQLDSESDGGVACHQP